MLYHSTTIRSANYCGDKESYFINLSNETNFEDSTSQIRHIAYTIVAPLTLAMGIMGNILNLLIITKKPFIKGSTRVYLTALAISDLSVMITVIPMVIRWNYTQWRTYEAAFYHAHIELFLNNTFIAFSVFIVVCLTIERYFSICIPTKFRNVHSVNVAKNAITCCFVIAFLVSVPLTGLKNVCRLNTTSLEGCIEWDFHENDALTNTIYWKAYLFSAESLVRFGPCILLCVLNILIIKKFRIITRKRKILKETLIRSRDVDIDYTNKSKYKKGLRNKKYQEEKRVIALLHAIVALFFITMTPSAILSLIYSELYESSFSFQVFRAAANNLELSNFAMNFYVYFFCSKEFRTALAEFIINCIICEEQIIFDVEMVDVDTDKLNNMLKVKIDDISDFNSTGDRFSVDYSVKSTRND